MLLFNFLSIILYLALYLVKFTLDLLFVIYDEHNENNYQEFSIIYTWILIGAFLDIIFALINLIMAIMALHHDNHSYLNVFAIVSVIYWLANLASLIIGCYLQLEYEMSFLLLIISAISIGWNLINAIIIVMVLVISNIIYQTSVEVK